MIEESIRDYLRSRTSVMSLLNNDDKRCNIDWTGEAKAKHITIFRAGGPLHAYLPHQNPVVIIHCFAGSRSAAAELAEAVANALRSINQSHEPLRSCSVESLSYVPAVDGTARYSITSVVTSRLDPIAV